MDSITKYFETMFWMFVIFLGLFIITHPKPKLTKITDAKTTVFVDLTTLKTDSVVEITRGECYYEFTVFFSDTFHTFQYQSREDAEKAVKTLFNIW